MIHKRLVSTFLGCACIFPSLVFGSFQETIDLAGFIYEPKQDIYVSRLEPFQRYFGYHDVFDLFAPIGAMVVDSEPVIFNYREKRMRIELWKGQYFVSTGSEIGIYEWNGVSYDAVKDEDMLHMSYTLLRKGEKLFVRNAVHWWLSGFAPGTFTDPDDLILKDVHIEFKDVEMRDAFLQQLYALGYDDDNDEIRAPIDSAAITFTYSVPKSPQVGNPIARKLNQIRNRTAVNIYERRKAKIGATDNSPETIERVIGTAFANNPRRFKNKVPRDVDLPVAAVINKRK